MLGPEDLFDLEGFEHRDIFAGCKYAWQVLPKIEEYIHKLLGKHTVGHRSQGIVSPNAWVLWENVLVGPGTTIDPGAYVAGPAIIGKNCQIRNSAYVRENVIIADDAILGHTSEAKNAILMPEAKAPHFNYVGDSVLGWRVNLGAGTKISNLKVTAGNVTVNLNGKVHDTGLVKFGALIGDDVQTGCNSVLNPGTIIGKGSWIYPNASVRGYIPPNSILKLKQELEEVEQKTAQRV